jgi:glycosyltransferase involved in cell wall biosynthesis
MRLAIVIPAYNEATTLRDVAMRALVQCPEVYVVDDGSTDATASTIADLPLTLIRHARNQGKAASLWDGLGAAIESGVDWVATLDGDGQHRPEELPRLMAAAQRYPQRIVIGARLRDRARAPRGRRIANRMADIGVSWASGHPVADSQSGQRVYPAPLLRLILGENRVRHDAHAAFTLESELVIAAAPHGYATVAVPIDTIYLDGRPSHFRGLRDTASITWMVARRIGTGWLNPAGLWRALTARPLVLSPEPSEPDSPKSTIARRRGAFASRRSRSLP